MTRLASEENVWAEPRDDRTAALLEGALAAARRGIPVLPLDGKVPVGWLVPNGVKDATVDEDQIRCWWLDGSKFNVGGAVPRGVVVLDVDPRNGGDESLEELRRKYGEPVRTLRCNSGGHDRGYHLWYRWGGPRLSARGLAGVDLKTYGGYLVLPPSIHPDSGRQYSWAETAPLSELPIAPLSELPSSLYGVLLDLPTTSLVREYEHPLVRRQQQVIEAPSKPLVREYEQLSTHIVLVEVAGIPRDTRARVRDTGAGTRRDARRDTYRGARRDADVRDTGEGMSRGVEGVLFPGDDSRERFRYVGYARELGWSQSHFLQEVGREGSPVAGYAALALNGKHGDDLARILGDDWRRSKEQDRERGRTPTASWSSTPTSRAAEVTLPPDIGLWAGYAFAAIRPSRRRYELGALVEAFARIAAREGRRFEGSYRYLAVQSGVCRHEHVYSLALELEGLGVVVATNRGERATESEPTRWALLGEGDALAPSVPVLVPIWISVALGWRCREVWRVLCSGVTEMKHLDLALGIDRDTLRPELERLEGRGLARRTGNGRWVRWVGLSMENATGTEGDREALDAIAAEYRKVRATFKKNNYRNVGTRTESERPGPSQELAEAQSAYDQAVQELVDWSSHLRIAISYGVTDEQQAAVEQLAELEAAVEGARGAKNAAAATPRRREAQAAQEKVPEKANARRPGRPIDIDAGKRRVERMRLLVEQERRDRRLRRRESRDWTGLTNERLVQLIEDSLGHPVLDSTEIDLDQVRATGEVVDQETGEVLCVLAV